MIGERSEMQKFFLKIIFIYEVKLKQLMGM